MFSFKDLEPSYSLNAEVFTDNGIVDLRVFTDNESEPFTLDSSFVACLYRPFSGKIELSRMIMGNKTLVFPYSVGKIDYIELGVVTRESSDIRSSVVMGGEIDEWLNKLCFRHKTLKGLADFEVWTMAGKNVGRRITGVSNVFECNYTYGELAIFQQNNPDERPLILDQVEADVLVPYRPNYVPNPRELRVDALVN